VRLFREVGAQCISIKSPAKVNLHLEVLAKRSDGYHDIRSIMVPIDLCDVLYISLIESDRIEVSSDQADLPVDEKNLAYRAALLILEETRKAIGVKIRIEKRIPVAAGLGGGSSNAAATLLGLNRLLGTRLTRREMMRLGARLGADVPFFVFGHPALARGIGENIQPLVGLPQFWFLLVYPGIRISTRWAYERLNLWLTKPPDHIINMPTFSWDISNLGSFLRNDLEKAVMPAYPVLQSIKHGLLRAGAVSCLMSGSGSTIYGMFSVRQKAQRAYEELRKDSEGRRWNAYLARSTGY
jgi:4-diphosphocytidyl-2-C-methyl-D-erythritol kinase